MHSGLRVHTDKEPLYFLPVRMYSFPSSRRVSVYASRNRKFTAFRPLRPFHVGVAIAGTHVVDTVFQFIFLDSETGYVFSLVQVYGVCQGEPVEP